MDWKYKLIARQGVGVAHHYRQAEDRVSAGVVCGDCRKRCQLVATCGRCEAIAARDVDRSGGWSNPGRPGPSARLQQIVTNLLSNAIKFTPSGGRIEIFLQRRDADVQLKIKDTGLGIAAENPPHVFERFRQVDSTNVRAHGGLGLGLAIVHYLVNQQAGTVTAESAGIDKGATFTVEFPLTSSEVMSSDLASVAVFSEGGTAALESAEPFSEQKLRNQRILVVEDDQDTQELLRTVLRRHGAEVSAVASCAEALEEIGRRKPHVIISDIGMVGENGYDLIRSVRSLSPEDGAHIPAIALTAYAGVTDRRRALLAGFQTHLPKPVEPEDLVAVILSLTFQPENSGQAEEVSRH